jgi:hypothetical protein
MKYGTVYSYRRNDIIHIFIINHNKNQGSSAGISPGESFFRTAHSRAKTHRDACGGG